MLDNYKYKLIMLAVIMHTVHSVDVLVCMSTGQITNKVVSNTKR